MKSNLYNLRNTAKLFRAMSLIFCTVLIFADQYSGYSSTTVNVYPQTSTRWTGSVVANGTISTSSVMYSQGGGNSRSWMKVDLSGIPVGSIINSVSIKYFVTSMYNPQLQFRKVTTDPVTAPGSTLFSQIGSGYNYITVSANSLGWNTRTPTGGFQTQLRTDIQNSIATGWFALGIYDVDGSSYFEAYIDGWNQLNKPYLVINYTSTLNNDIALDSITSPLNFAC